MEFRPLSNCSNFNRSFLAIHYCEDVSLVFSSVRHICRDVNYEWLLRIYYANGARFFICLFYTLGEVFTMVLVFLVDLNSGSSFFFAVMVVAFLGYVLVWGQISFWGATVITNLFSAIPYLGGDLVEWIWGGGFAVDNATLTRFFSLQFLLPFVAAGLRMVHLLFLHQTGRGNPIGVNRNFDKILFHLYFISKDLFRFLLYFLGSGLLFLYFWD